MSDNEKNINQRLKILYLYKIFLEKTDEEHSIKMPEIINQLSLCGISAGRKAVYEDIEALRTFGLDIISVKGNASGYYVASREFELPELKLLADAVSSSRFLTEKKSEELLKKIEGLSSIYEAKQLRRQIYVANRIKSGNERVYLNIDVIHRAIEQNRKITFKYFDYDIRKKKKYRDGLRTCSPYALTWTDERYYLIAFYEKRMAVNNFRVDRMEDVQITDIPAEPRPADFSVAEYVGASFSMFSGKSESVRLRFENGLVNAVIDHFGKKVSLFPDGKDHFTVTVNVKTEYPGPFFGWLFKFGTMVEIVEPRELKDRYIKHLETVLEAARGDETDIGCETPDQKI